VIRRGRLRYGTAMGGGVGTGRGGLENLRMEVKRLKEVLMGI